MAGDILGVSVSGALASQRALATTGHNIANANTEGYSRQRVDLATRPPQLSADGGIGTGVSIDNVRRMYDSYVASEVIDNTSVSQSLDTGYEYTSQVDNLLADPNVGLAPALHSFFAAVNGVADDPQSTSARQVMLSEARSLSERFGYLNDRLDSLRSGVTKDMRNVVVEINDLSAAIAKVNDTIVKGRELGGNAPNDLLDQRDQLIQQLSSLVSVRTSEQDDGRMNVFIGNGQSLVIGSHAARMEVQGSRFDPDEAEIVFVGNGTHSIVTRFLSGGRLGGMLDFRKSVLDSSQNELGRIAIGIASSFNAQHRMGMDMNNELGGDFFTTTEQLAPRVLPHFANKSDVIVGAGITDVDRLTTSDYMLSYHAGQYHLVRLVDDKLIGSYASLPVEVESEGFNLNILSGTGIQEGDKFTIRPTRGGAENFAPILDDVAKFAAAGPLRAMADIGNLGDGRISTAEIKDIDNPAFDRVNHQLKPPFVIRFVDATHFEVLDNTGNPVKFKQAAVPAEPAIGANVDGEASPAIPATPAVPPSVTTVLEYDPATGKDIFPTPTGEDFGFRVRIDGTPQAGDQFRIDYNTDGVGDNRNALKLAALQDLPVLNGGTTDYSQAYSQLVSRVGSKTHELDMNGRAQRLLLSQAVDRKEAISGVNLDEEAANMVRYQNLYQANAQVISVANKMLETLINSFR